MRIGIYDPYLDSLGGGEKYMLSAAECLSQKHDVQVFWHDKNILQQAQEKFNLELSKVNISPNIFASNFPSLKRLKETREYDLIFCLSDGSIPLTFARKTILHFQFPVEWVKAKTFANKIKLKRISEVICNSKFTKHYIDKKFDINSKVIYPPCVSTHPMGEDDSMLNKQNIVLTVGRYNALSEGGSFKKHEVMLNTWKQMIDGGLKNWKFIVATSYLEENKKYVDELEKQIGKYPIKIIRDGSFNEISELYKTAKIYWHAAGFGEDSNKHPERAEHFGISTVEAMYQGAVPVVINAGGQTEIITDAEDGFLWNTTEELVRYTNKLIEHDTIRIKMARAARETAKKFSSENFCSELKKIGIQ